MDGEIEDVIARDIEATDPVIDRERKESYISPHKGTVKIRGGVRRVEKIAEVFDDGIIANKKAFIPLKRRVEGIGIDYKAEQADYGNMKKVPIENS